MVPNIPYAWQTKSNPILLPASRGRSLTVVGLMNRSNNLFYQVHETSFKSENMISYLDEFASQITKKTVIILDNCSIHKSKIFKEKMKEWEKHDDMHIYILPPYSPELNLIEILWKRIKYQWLDFSAYENFSNLKLQLKSVLDDFGQKYDIKF